MLLRGGSAPAADFAAQLAEQASAVLQVRPGRVDEIAGELLGELDRAAELLVALGLPGLVVVEDGLGAGRPRALGVHGDAGYKDGLTVFYGDLPDKESAERWVASQLEPYPDA